MFKKGDRIKRIGSDFNDIKVGDICIFDGYVYDDKETLMVEGHDLKMYSHKFVLVGDTAFEKCKYGDRVFHIGMGWGKVSYKSTGLEYIKITFDIAPDDNRWVQFDFEGRMYNSSACRYEENKTLFWDEVNITNIPCKKKVDLHIDEFIAAMKTLIKEYVDGTHEYNVDACSLCQIVKKYTPGWKDRESDCSLCPWIVITGNKCKNKNDDKARIIELLDWVEQYEKMREEQ